MTRVALGVMALAVAASARAQQPRTTASLSSRPLVVDTSRHAGPGDEPEARSVVVAGATPRSFRVVTVGVPAELAGAAKVAYEVVNLGGVSLLGASSGVVVAGGNVVLTVGIPGTATAGRTRAGFVRFVAPAGQPIRVPIEVEIARIARIQVTAAQPMRGARPGDRVDLAFTILNAGNLRDTLDLEVDAPPTWSASIAEAPRLVLQRGESIERTVTARVPLSADLGDGAIMLIVHSRSGERAVASSIVEVTDPARSGRRPGPVVTLGVASEMSAGVPGHSVESVAIDGPVTDAVTVSGRFSTPMSQDLIAGRALSTLGYNSQANFFTLAAPNWGGTIGTTGLNLDDLAGQNVFGRGASLRFGPAEERVQLLGASPLAAQGTAGSPTLFAATAQKQFAFGLLTTFFSHLRDSAYLVRSVDALGVGIDAEPWEHATVSGALAGRSYRDGNGLGAEANFRGPIAGGDLFVRLTHAPGGSSAFAPARDLASLGGDRSFGRLNTAIGYWSTRDDDAAHNAISSSGWSLTPTYPLFATLTLGLDLGHSSVTSRDSMNGFGSSQNDFGLRARLLRGGFDLSGDTRLTTFAQSVSDSVSTIQDGSSKRVMNRLRLDHVGLRGAFGVGGSAETAILGGSPTPPQTTFDAHVERFQFWPRFPRWTVSANAQRLRYGDIAVTTSRAELNVDVHNALRVALAAERGSVRDAFGAMHTVITLRVERSSNVGAFDRRLVTGIVFQDRNGNGLRDAGEPGVPGIVVHRGSETAVTDANGEYRMTTGSAARAEVDDRSLPQGWLQSPRLLDRAMDGLVLGVIPITALDVRLDLAPNADGSMPSVRLGTATFTLRDSTGREWIARADGSLHATFDALPAGHYALTTDLDGSSEPLVIDPTPQIEVGGMPGRQRVVVTVRTRPVKIFKSKQQSEKRDRGAS